MGGGYVTEATGNIITIIMPPLKTLKSLTSTFCYPLYHQFFFMYFVHTTRLLLRLDCNVVTLTLPPLASQKVEDQHIMLSRQSSKCFPSQFRHLLIHVHVLCLCVNVHTLFVFD